MTSEIGTTCVQGGYHPGNGEPRQIPIYQNTTWKYDSSEFMGRLFDLEEEGYFYTRLRNPTNDYVAAKICELEGWVSSDAHVLGTGGKFLCGLQHRGLRRPRGLLDVNLRWHVQPVRAYDEADGHRVHLRLPDMQ